VKPTVAPKRGRPRKDDNVMKYQDELNVDTPQTIVTSGTVKYTPKFLKPSLPKRGPGRPKKSEINPGTFQVPETKILTKENIVLAELVDTEEIVPPHPNGGRPIKLLNTTHLYNNNHQIDNYEQVQDSSPLDMSKIPPPKKRGRPRKHPPKQDTVVMAELVEVEAVETTTVDSVTETDGILTAEVIQQTEVEIPNLDVCEETQKGTVVDG